MNKLLNKKIEEYKDNIDLKKYKENKNYKHKKVFLKEKNHIFARNMLPIHGIIMRGYLQSVMEKVLSDNNN